MGLDLYIFDFDDTLAVSDSRVQVIRKDGTVLWMDSRQFAEFHSKDDDQILFDDFKRADGTIIKDTCNEMLRAMADVGDHVFIVTARAYGPPVEEFLTKQLGKSPPVIATSGSHGKKPWLLQQLRKTKYERVIVYEDCKHNIRSLKEAVTEHNAATGESVFYSAMCILEDQTSVKVESRWRDENLLIGSDFREITRNFLRKTW